jgi:hypothetical protein
MPPYTQGGSAMQVYWGPILDLICLQFLYLHVKPSFLQLLLSFHELLELRDPLLFKLLRHLQLLQLV